MDSYSGAQSLCMTNYLVCCLLIMSVGYAYNAACSCNNFHTAHTWISVVTPVTSFDSSVKIVETEKRQTKSTSTLLGRNIRLLCSHQAVPKLCQLSVWTKFICLLSHEKNSLHRKQRTCWSSSTWNQNYQPEDHLFCSTTVWSIFLLFHNVIDIQFT